MPAPARTLGDPAVLPAPPTARLLVIVRLLAVRVLEKPKMAPPSDLDGAAETRAGVGAEVAAVRVAAAADGLVGVEGAVRE